MRWTQCRASFVNEHDVGLGLAKGVSGDLHSFMSRHKGITISIRVPLADSVYESPSRNGIHLRKDSRTPYFSIARNADAMLCKGTQFAETGSLCSLGSLCCPPLPLPPRCPPPLWFCCPPSSFDAGPAVSGPPIVSCAVASRLERSIWVRIVLARYETARTSWMWLLLQNRLAVCKRIHRQIGTYKSLSISAGSTLGANARALSRY